MSAPAPLVTTHPLGASIHSILVPGAPSSANESLTNILLSFPHPVLFSTHPHPFFGETIGRMTNRIANARLEGLNGKTYELFANDGNNNLHGGKEGWGKKLWEKKEIKCGQWDSGIASILGPLPNGEERDGVLYHLVSLDGDEGFPGTLEVKVWYFEGRGPNGEVVLDVEYEVEFSKGTEGEGVEETVIGVTNHGYFNLNGQPHSLTDHEVILSTPKHLKLDPSKPGIPTGEITPHPLVPERSQEPFNLSSSSDPKQIRDIDDCFVLDEDPSSIPLDTRTSNLRSLATVKGLKTGIVLKVESTEPAFQFYTGKFMDIPAWEAGKAVGVEYPAGEGWGPHAGFCIEPSRYVDAVSRPEWRGMCLLKRGSVFGSRTRYWAWKE